MRSRFQAAACVLRRRPFIVCGYLPEEGHTFARLAVTAAADQWSGTTQVHLRKHMACST